MRVVHVAILAFTLVPLLGRTQEPSGVVTAGAAEFRIPLQRPANDVWTWNRAETADNASEYSWAVTAKSAATQYFFGFFLYKFPGSREAHGSIQDLLKAGQNSVFREEADGHGGLLTDAKVEVTVEDKAIVVRLTNPELVRLIFRDRPETVEIHSRTPAADYAVVRVTYRE
jgi:hypothetical protein